jgi:cyanophycinase
MSSENAEVYQRILELGGPDGRVAILPTASGVPNESGPSARDLFNRYGGEERAFIVGITMEDYSSAADPVLADAIRDARVVYFTGGDQNRILRAFRPETGDTVSYGAVLDVLKSGGVVAGTSAGAAMMSDPIIGGGTSRAALVSGVRGDDVGEDGSRGVLLTRGMGFFPFGITDQHFLARGRLGRLIVALEHAGVPRGYGIDENAGIEVDLSTGMIQTLGNDRALLLADISGMKREGEDRLGIRISLLGGSDRVNGHSGKPSFGADKQPIVAPADAPAELPINDAAWGRDAIPAMIESLALSNASEIRGLDGDDWLIVLTRDSKSRFAMGPSGANTSIAAINLRLDILRRAPAP